MEKDQLENSVIVKQVRLCGFCGMDITNKVKFYDEMTEKDYCSVSCRSVGVRE